MDVLRKSISEVEATQGKRGSKHKHIRKAA
jgi:hypothetical protein